MMYDLTLERPWAQREEQGWEDRMYEDQAYQEQCEHDVWRQHEHERWLEEEYFASMVIEEYESYRASD